LVLPLDPSEELFTADAGPEAEHFLALLADLVGRINATEVGLIVAATVRTDRYEVMHNHPALGGINSVLFNELKPMPPLQFRKASPARPATPSRPISTCSSPPTWLSGCWPMLPKGPTPCRCCR
jgi:hypothetical protein